MKGLMCNCGKTAKVKTKGNGFRVSCVCGVAISSRLYKDLLGLNPVQDEKEVYDAAVATWDGLRDGGIGGVARLHRMPELIRCRSDYAGWSMDSATALDVLKYAEDKIRDLPEFDGSESV